MSSPKGVEFEGEHLPKEMLKIKILSNVVLIPEKKNNDSIESLQTIVASEAETDDAVKIENGMLLDEVPEPSEESSNNQRDDSDAESGTNDLILADIESEFNTMEITEVTRTPADIINDERSYFKDTSIIELARHSWTSTSEKQHYTRGCLWSPDGTCVLSAVNFDGMHVMELPKDLYQNLVISIERPVDLITSAVHVKEGGTVYDYCWYPLMNSVCPETCCWIASRQHEPIQMWDAFSGELRCSYRGYDSVDEIESAISVAFTDNGQNVIGGYKKTLKIFDTAIPGRSYTEIPVKKPCSCIAVQRASVDVIATGSWNCTVNLYDLRSPEWGALATLTGHSGGVTYLKYSPDGKTIVSGARKDKKLLQWDLRNYSQPLRWLERNVTTNQRVYFDFSKGGKWLLSGDTEGTVHFWDLENEDATQEYQFNLHHDCCNGVSLHPYRPIFATSCGQHHFIKDAVNELEEVYTYENSLIFWWLGNFEYSI